MNQAETAALNNALVPIGDSASELIRSAIVLRVKVEIETSLMNGAEDEDIPKIIEREIFTANELIAEFTNGLSRIEQARKLGMLE